jgi:hypothetical protein
VVVGVVVVYVQSASLHGLIILMYCGGSGRSSRSGGGDGGGGGCGSRSSRGSGLVEFSIYVWPHIPNVPWSSLAW